MNRSYAPLDGECEKPENKTLFTAAPEIEEIHFQPGKEHDVENTDGAEQDDAGILGQDVQAFGTKTR